MTTLGDGGSGALERAGEVKGTHHDALNQGLVVSLGLDNVAAILG